MDVFKLLIVEDDDTFVLIYKEKALALKDILSTEFQIVQVKNLKDVTEKIQHENFDGISIDLKLSKNDNPDEFQGNDIIISIVNSARCPIIVVSALSDYISETDFCSELSKHS